MQRVQRTEVGLGALLGAMLIGLSLLIGKFLVAPSATKTVLAQLTEASLGHNVGFYVVQFATMVLLALAANTSFGGMPVLASLLARDNHLPHVFALRADRQVYRYVVLVLAATALVLLIAAEGDTQKLVPVFAIRGHLPPALPHRARADGEDWPVLALCRRPAATFPRGCGPRLPACPAGHFDGRRLRAR